MDISKKGIIIGCKLSINIYIIFVCFLISFQFNFKNPQINEKKEIIKKKLIYT